MRAAVWSSVEGLPECLRLFGSSVMSALLRKSAAQMATQTEAVLVPSSCQLFWTGPARSRGPNVFQR